MRYLHNCTTVIPPSALQNAPFSSNTIRIQWEEFIRSVALDKEWKYSLAEGAKGVQLAEIGVES